ncbi:MAG: hypothetical protein ACPLKP_01770 [Microgenomates group bacterium]
MKSFFKFLLPINLVSLSGLLLLLLGFILLPFLVGFPLIILGTIIISLEFLNHTLKFFPGGKIVKDYYKSFLSSLFKILRK